ncbi:MAG TPA: ABC transporter ATP-binding protein [Chloroflexota bacterium]|nr:ABC transporter ATP-binding protein [Chloroflexota bacterium]
MSDDVTLAGVSKRFGADVVALESLDLSIRKGEFFSLLGPSGCGKTTTLRIIAGFETPTAGEVYVGGENMADRPPNKRPVNTVFQSYALFQHMNVYDNIAFGLQQRKVPKAEIKQRVEAALRLVRLEGYGRRRPRELSGGQQQRVALARAVVNRPTVLLLDEPLGALDLKLRKEMQLELKSIQHELGTTFVYVTHDQEEALTMSDRIAVMNRARLEQIGEPSEIYERPRTRFVADFIGITNFFSGQVQGLDGDRVRFLSDGGLNLCMPRSGSVKSGPSTVAVRPEKIKIAEQAHIGAVNRCEGVVEDVVYLGSTSHHRVRTSGGETIIVLRQNDSGTAVFAPGSRVSLWWEPESTHLLED